MNIALIKDGVPIFGVVYAPVLEQTYVGVLGQGAYKITAGVRVDITPKTWTKGETWKIVGSRSHQSPEIDALLDSLEGETELIAMGSSLKLCLVAEGAAHLYPRLGPTCEWDTGAAQAVVEAAGGKVTIIEVATDALKADAPPLRYNQKDSILNPCFLVSY